MRDFILRTIARLQGKRAEAKVNNIVGGFLEAAEALNASVETLQAERDENNITIARLRSRQYDIAYAQDRAARVATKLREIAQ